MNRVKILGVPIDAVTMQEALRMGLSFLDDGQKHHIMTPNNEMLLQTKGNSAFYSLLQKTDLNIPDSVGLQYAAKWKGQNIPERVTGVDFTQKLCRRLTKKHPVFLLGGRDGVALKAANALQLSNPNLVIAGTYEGSPDESDASRIIQIINDSGASVLFVAFGSPYQDLWINQYLMNLVSVKVAMGVGGTFDFLSGRIKRAPAFMRSLGLEWLWFD